MPLKIKPQPDATENIEPSTGNATRPLEKPQVRRKASMDQAKLLEEGANALPVSDYPLKEGPAAANRVDLRQRARAKLPPKATTS